MEELGRVAKLLCQPGKGLLAADESQKSTQKRFDAVGVACTEETRRQYRELLLTTPGSEEYLDGVILFDETFWQSTSQGQVFREYLKSRGVMPGIKVDKGLVDLPGFDGEKATEGLDGLPERMKTYAGAGAKFAKWRAVFSVSDDTPTRECIEANAYLLARYARICQDAGIVPIVEPEVIFDGRHTAQQCEDAIAKVLTVLFGAMKFFRVHLPGSVLKTSMVLPGKDSGVPIDYDDVAARTVRVLHGHVPPEIGGVVFLSGGQAPMDAFMNLNRIARMAPHPWGMTFSYSRALQDPVLRAWAQNPQDVIGAQRIFHNQLRLAADASLGKLDEDNLNIDSFVSHAQDL